MQNLLPFTQPNIWVWSLAPFWHNSPALRGVNVPWHNLWNWEFSELNNKMYLRHLAVWVKLRICLWWIVAVDLEILLRFWYLLLWKDLASNPWVRQRRSSNHSLKILRAFMILQLVIVHGKWIKGKLHDIIMIASLVSPRVQMILSFLHPYFSLNTHWVPTSDVYSLLYKYPSTCVMRMR